MTKFKIGDKVWVLLNDDERIGTITYIMPKNFENDPQNYGVSIGAAKIYIAEHHLKPTDFQTALNRQEQK